MFSRRQRIALISAAAAVMAGAGVTVATTALAAATRYEAETAPSTCDGAIESNHAGYSGSGFCNANNAAGAAAQFTLTASGAGSATIAIRYANGATDNRPADVLVNGTVVQAASAFNPTGAWTAWATKTLTAPLNVGSNTLRLSPTTAVGLANIDYVDVEVGGTTPSTPPPAGTGKQMEDLDRGVISVRSGAGNLVSWRLLGTEAANTGFNVYRGATKLNASPIITSTNYLDAGASGDASYAVRAVVGGVEQAASGASLRFANGYLDVPISSPGSGYTANDASVGDLDGDGQYEIVLKWDPADAKDNSQSGVTGVVYVDAYRLGGQRLWRINLGRNIRAGAHYTQFQVYDYDGDGRAEVAMKTADATVDGTGRVIGSSSADHRNSSGYVLSGPEYLTMFNGLTGAAMSTVDYLPPRGTVSSWGDSYGNRVDRFLAGTAYLDGKRPSLVMARGYYTRSVIVAWDFRNGTLTRRWTFDSNSSGNGAYAGQGNHQLAVADVDQDGRDEIVYGSMAVDDNGARLWNTGNGHGDALHVGDLDPSRPGLEEFKVDEDSSKPSSWMADARTGQVLWTTPAGGDNGRGVSGDIWAGSAGAESWSAAANGVRNPKGAVVATRKPGSMNFLAWWDGDTTRELLDGTHIDKYGTSGDTRLLTASGVHSNNSTKSTPSLSGDLLGDWREEVVWPTSDNTALRVYSTPAPTSTRLFTLMHDPQYRCAIAWQNTAYNQPPHPSYFIGSGMATPPAPVIYVR
ncbi:carbohydrate-binding protein [Micromonospora matsumotoense]|uniref:rhamnogalacturonan lyase family protein n=1 Tax=Micromonospora matsumotoense TaxID=121616 RepID=UPI0034392F7C